ncbi:MAG: hypothetical protein J2P23_09980 [Microlunatus sp.]|nr:hypothetical protein [Microlunatus sp.]
MNVRVPVPAKSAVGRLLQSDEPGIRYLTHRDVLGDLVAADAEQIMTGPKVRALLSGQQADGGFGEANPGRGWRSTKWRLVALVELGASPDDPRVLAAADYYLDWVLGLRQHRRGPTVINGLPRVCAHTEGTALVVGSRLGMGEDPRLRTLAQALLDWRWPDGGWNCGHAASGRRSTFHESLTAAWGLHEFALVSGDEASDAAAGRAAELFLDHRLIYSNGTGIPSERRPSPPPRDAVINSRWPKLGYPSYWHYDILAALMFVARRGSITDERAGRGLDHLRAKQRDDGLWAADDQWWKPADSRFRHQYEVVDWGLPGQPSEMITLNALRILRAANRLDLDG